MRRVVVTLFAACAALAVPAAVLAQPAPAPAPAPAAPTAIPDQMPFDVPYGASITADRAAQVVAAAVAEAKKSPRNWNLAISVVDPNGDLVYFYKMDQTQIASVGISQGKARTAARFRRPSRSSSTSCRLRPAPSPARSTRHWWPLRAASPWSRAARSSARLAAAAPPAIRTRSPARLARTRSSNRGRKDKPGRGVGAAVRSFFSRGRSRSAASSCARAGSGWHRRWRARAKPADRENRA